MTRESQNNQSNQYVRDFSSSDERYLRQAIVLSQQAGARGNRPFGAVIADARGELVAQAENDTITAHDCTGPDAALGPDGDRADDDGIGVDERVGVDDRDLVTEGVDRHARTVATARMRGG